MSSFVKNIAAVLLACAVLFLGWFLTNGAYSEGNLLAGTVKASSETQKFRAILSDISTINLESDLLTDESFLRMKDLSQEVAGRQLYRSNPFRSINASNASNSNFNSSFETIEVIEQ